MFGLDTEAFASSGGDVDGVELAAVDLLQHRLPGHSEHLGGLAERQPAVGDVRPDALAERLVDADPPGRAGVSCSPAVVVRWNSHGVLATLGLAAAGAISFTRRDLAAG